MKEGWEVQKLGVVSAINYGFTEKASGDPIGPRFLRITDIQDDRVNWGNVPFCKIEKIDLPRYRLENGDIVFARTGATTGKSFLVEDPPEAVFASYLIRLRLVDKKLLPEFVALFFQTDAYWKTIQEGVSGSAQGGFNASKLAELSVPIPSVSEQKRIVSFLEKAFGGLATAKANTEQSQRNARALFESHLQTVFTRGGSGWMDKPLGELCDILDSLRKPITKRDRVPGNIPYYGATGIQDYVDGYIFDESLVLVGEDGAKWGAGEHTAFAISGKSWVNNHAHVLRPRRNIVLDSWLIYFLTISDLSEFVSGLTVPKLNQGSLRGILIPVPPLDEQKRLLQTADLLRDKTQRLESLCQKKLAALGSLKQSLLHHAFNGDL